MTTVHLIGDSVTETVDENGAHRANWPDYVFPIAGVTLTTSARSGGAFWSNSNVPGRNFSTQASDLIASPTDIAIIAMGTNDWGNSTLSGGGSQALGDYATAVAKDFGALDLGVSIEAMRHGLQRIRYYLPMIKLFGVTPLQRGDSYSPTDDMRVWVDAMCRMYRFYGVEIIDCFNEAGIVHGLETVSGSGQHLLDMLHPRTSGMQLQARVIAPRLKAYLSQ